MRLAARLGKLLHSSRCMPAPWLSELAAKISACESRLDELQAKLEKLYERVGVDRPKEFEIANLLSREKRAINIAELRHRAQTVGTAEGTAICRTLGKYMQYVSTRDIGYAPYVMLDGFYEYHVTEFVVRNVSSGMRVMDLGANFGYYTLLMADLVGRDGVVHAFEPNPLAADMLERSLRVNGYDLWVDIDRRVIWDRSDEIVTFYIPGIAPTNARIIDPLDGRAIEPEPEREEGTNTEVKTIALDDLDIAGVDFIKADIEGAEERLWRGGKEFLSRNSDAIFLMEFNCARCSDPRTVLTEIASAFPLRWLDEESFVREGSIEQIMESREDWLLVLAHKRTVR